jgi:Flp pilus assembly protein TadG
MKTQSQSLKHRNQPRRATAAVELAVVMPLIIILLTGLLEVGRMVQISEILNNAAREGARKASTGINTYADVKTAVANYLTNAGITNQTNLTVTVYNVTQSNSGPSFDGTSANWMDQLKITVTLPLNNVQLTQLHILVTDPSTILTATSVWFSNQDQSYPTNITPPSGS